MLLHTWCSCVTRSLCYFWIGPTYSYAESAIATENKSQAEKLLETNNGIRYINTLHNTLTHVNLSPAIISSTTRDYKWISWHLRPCIRNRRHHRNLLDAVQHCPFGLALVARCWHFRSSAHSQMTSWTHRPRPFFLSALVNLSRIDPTLFSVQYGQAYQLRLFRVHKPCALENFLASASTIMNG